MMQSQRRQFPYSLHLILMGALVVYAIHGYGQTVSSDSLSLHSEDSEILFQAKRMRLERLQVDLNRSGVQSLLPQDLEQTIKEADSAAQADDYLLATAYLDIALQYLDQQSRLAITAPKPTNAWQVEAIAGSDVWQQKYSISLTDQDSSIYESSGNPYIGLRATYNGHDQRGALLRAIGEGKYGQEYGSGLVELSYEAPVGSKLRLHFSDRLEGTHYQIERDLRYWNNQFRGWLTWQWHRFAALTLEQEQQDRRYIHPSTFFTSYNQAQWALRLQAELPRTLRTELRYDRRNRDYREQPDQAFHENNFTLFWYPVGFHSWSLRGMAQSRNRRYNSGYIDSLLTNDFQEWYAQSVLTIGRSSALSLQLSATWNSRKYIQADQSTPDYGDLIVEPTLSYMLNGHYTLKAGYRFRRKHHTSSDAEVQASVAMENYRAHAPVAGIEIIWGSLLLNLYDVYEFRRYPESTATEYPLYSDRDTHSLFFYMTWSLSSRWSFNAMANMDQDLARNEQGSDARSNILNFELLYKF